jgi:hypothetical protein
VTAWTPPPPGDTREQLPDRMLALIDDRAAAAETETE